MTQGSGRLLLAVAAALLCHALPAPADTGSDWFDEQTDIFRLVLGFDLPQPPASRAQFMACGYVAPRLSAEEPPPAGGDQAFAQMLERLRGLLRAFGNAP